VNSRTSKLSHTENGEQVADGTNVLKVSSERVVPRDGVGALGKVLVVLELESGGLDGAESLGNLDHLGDTVTTGCGLASWSEIKDCRLGYIHLNSVADLTVLGVVGVVVVGHQPFVDTENSTGLEDLEDLGVDTLKGGGVDGSLDSVNGVERVGRERHLLDSLFSRSPARL
jgi:hypothetical protein